MKKYDATHPVWNRILAIVYAPLAFFCWLGLMAGERAISETDPLIIAACYLLAYGLFGVGVTVYPALLFSGRCFDRGHRLAGHLLRWYPVWMILVLGFLYEALMFLSGL